ncbi:MAG: M56 family metallopeptidase [Eubacteriales bacterium]|nr:M56 family metallopeptidase [Eubacteriales bacterium]
MYELLCTSSLLILAVCAIRAAAGCRLDARVRYALWALPALRLLLPFPLAESTRSVMNLLPEAGSAADALFPAGSAAQTAVSAGLPRMVWIAGSAAVGAWFACCAVRFALTLRRGRVWLGYDRRPLYRCDAPGTPCLFGGAVYLPSGLSEEAREHVMAHELAHARHGDAFFGLLRALLVTAYWWDPLVWLAAVLSRRDAEAACDLSAVRALGEDARFAYARTLIAQAERRSGCHAPFPAFLTPGAAAKRRIRELVSDARRPVFSALAAALALTLAVCAFTGGMRSGYGASYAVGCSAAAWDGASLTLAFDDPRIPPLTLAVPDDARRELDGGGAARVIGVQLFLDIPWRVWRELGEPQRERLRRDPVSALGQPGVPLDGNLTVGQVFFS